MLCPCGSGPEITGERRVFQHTHRYNRGMRQFSRAIRFAFDDRYQRHGPTWQGHKSRSSWQVVSTCGFGPWGNPWRARPLQVGPRHP